MNIRRKNPIDKILHCRIARLCKQLGAQWNTIVDANSINQSSCNLAPKEMEAVVEFPSPVPCGELYYTREYEKLGILLQAERAWIQERMMEIARNVRYVHEKRKEKIGCTRVSYILFFFFLAVIKLMPIYQVVMIYTSNFIPLPVSPTFRP